MPRRWEISETLRNKRITAALMVLMAAVEPTRETTRG